MIDWKKYAEQSLAALESADREAYLTDLAWNSGKAAFLERMDKLFKEAEQRVNEEYEKLKSSGGAG